MKKDYINHYNKSRSVRLVIDLMVVVIANKLKKLKMTKDEKMISALLLERNKIREKLETLEKAISAKRKGMVCTHAGATVKKEFNRYGDDWGGYQNYTGVQVDCKICGESGLIEICDDNNNLYGSTNNEGMIDLERKFDLHKEVDKYFKKSDIQELNERKTKKEKEEKELYEKLHEKFKDR